MFGEVSLYIVGFLLLASVVLRNGPLFIFSLVLLLMAAVSWLWDRYCLDKVEYRRELSQKRAFFGEEIQLVVEMVNRKPLPLAWLEAQDEIPSDLKPLKGSISPSYRPERSLLLNLVSLRWYERVRRHYRIRCDTRGYHTFGPAQLSSGDIFGFNTKKLEVPGEDFLLVYPKVVPITQLGLPSKDPFGDFKTRQWIFEDPLYTAGVREYAYGDSPRRIHWKATARSQHLQVKLYEPRTTYRLALFLNLNTAGPYWWWQGYSEELLELAITTAASVANWAVEQGYQVGLYINSHPRQSDQRVELAPSRDPEQLTHILEALAKAIPFAALPLETLLRLHARSLPYGTTVAVVTAKLSDAIVTELLGLKSAGHQVALLLIGNDAPQIELRGITTYRIGDEESWRELREIAVSR
ncbi:MAG: DUF58 domain-containing protein [Chloroflexota bacterium]